MRKVNCRIDCVDRGSEIAPQYPAKPRQRNRWQGCGWKRCIPGERGGLLNVERWTLSPAQRRHLRRSASNVQRSKIAKLKTQLETAKP